MTRENGGSGCSTRTLSGSASRDAALRRWSARRLAGANALQANQRPKARWSQRDDSHNVNVNAVWTEEDPDAERHIAWARDFFDAMQPHAGGRVYLNFLGEEGGNRVRQAYGAATYERLVELKRAYDPTNFFRLNQNIEP